MNNQILDNEEKIAFQNVLKKTRTHLSIFVLVYGLSSFTFLYMQSSITPEITGFIIGVFLLTCFNLSKYNKVYFYKIENSTLTLFLLSAWGEKMTRSFKKNDIKNTTLHSNYFEKKHGLTLETKYTKLHFDLKGEFILKELVPIFKNEWQISNQDI
jgi:hypothetical protein